MVLPMIPLRGMNVFPNMDARNRILVAAEHAPWPVLLRALARTTARAARHGLRGPVARGLRQALGGLRGALWRRRARPAWVGGW